MTAEQGAAKTYEPSRRDKVIIAVVLLIVFGAIFGHGSLFPSGPTDHATSNCEDAVKGQLKSPSTADFSGERTSTDPTGITVRGNVDSENSFGAKIRTEWLCSTDASGNNANALLL